MPPDQSAIAIWIPLVSGLAGTLIGGALSILGGVIQARQQHKRERARLILEIATQHHERAVDWGKTMSDRGGRVAVQPLTAFIFSTTRMLDLIERGRVTPEDVRRLRDDVNAVEGLYRLSKEDSGSSEEWP